MSDDVAISLIKIALQIAPELARIIRDGVIANEGDADAKRVASVLPERSESQKALDTLRGDL